MPGSLRPYGLMLCGSMAFSIMAALAHALGPSLDWQIIAAVRTLMAFVIAATLALRAGVKLVFWRPGTLWIRSIAGSISLVSMYYAITRMPVADVLTLQNVFPVWVAVLSWPVLGEVPSGEAWTAIVVALCGVMLIEQPHFLAGATWPAAAALASSLTTAISMLGLHRLHRVDPRAIVAHFSAVAFTVCLVAIALLPHTERQVLSFDAKTLVMLVGVGVSATIGQLFLTKAFAAGPPARISVVALTQVGFGMLLDMLIWGHRFGPVSLAGMALVVAPTAWVLLNPKRPAAADFPAPPDTP